MALKSLNRKQERKQKRKEKKINRNAFHMRKKNQSNCNTDTLKEATSHILGPKITNNKKRKGKIVVESNIKGPIEKNNVLSTEQIRKKEQKEQQKISKEMIKKRKKLLMEANIEEDRIIRQLEKNLGLNKRKSKSLPKTFSEDGLDYLLEICDPQARKNAIAAEKGLHEVNDQFDEDFALMTEQNTATNTDINSEVDEYSSEDEDGEKSEFEDEILDDDDGSILENDGEEISDSVGSVIMNNNCRKNLIQVSKHTKKNKLDIDAEMESTQESDSEFSNAESSCDIEETKGLLKNLEKHDNKFSLKGSKQIQEPRKTKKRKLDIDSLDLESDPDIDSELSEDDSISRETKGLVKKNKKTDNTDNKAYSKKKKQIEEPKHLKNKSVIDEIDIESNQDSDSELSEADSSRSLEETKGLVKKNADGTWEDIYGRLRSKDGSVIEKKSEGTKYIPPALREKTDDSEDRKRVEKLNKLRKQLKGLINRLAESNMHSIASQIEDLYMKNSRNDMNDTLTNLILESLVSEVITPERLLIEHIVLVTVLHANVGTEVGAHFLQRVAKDFDNFLMANHEVENKLLDNIVNILAQLYNFKMFDCKLIYEVLEKFSEKFDEKCVECILHVLRSVGFSLRKDDPLTLKALILDLQKRALNAKDEMGDNSRVKFMLDILLAIKNNNVKKIPNYDTTYSEHLKKVMKGFIRKGNYVTQLNISLGDLLKADQRGRWWVVGSAWTGNETEVDERTETVNNTEAYSHKLLQLAKKQRMNTDTRKNIFCILMSAEDYLDAFEKILRLSLKNQQEREIINVILHCCLQEKKYNPYYGFVAQKFCDYNRKFQMIIKYSVWDKLKTLQEHSGNQLSNLAKLLTHLFMENGLAISTLKIVQFSELDNVTLRFMRQILIGILLHKDEEACLNVFLKVSKADKLKMFRESLKLFIHHFLLRNLNSEKISEDHKLTLQNRAKVIEKILSSKETRF